VKTLTILGTLSLLFFSCAGNSAPNQAAKKSTYSFNVDTRAVSKKITKAKRVFGNMDSGSAIFKNDRKLTKKSDTEAVIEGPKAELTIKSKK